MPRNLRLRIVLVLVVVAASVWYLFPPKKTINLGLDLQGGIHLMLGVEADKHVASQTDRAAEDLKSALDREALALERALEILGRAVGLTRDVLVGFDAEHEVDPALQIEPEVDRLLRREQIPDGGGHDDEDERDAKTEVPRHPSRPALPSR